MVVVVEGGVAKTQGNISISSSRLGFPIQVGLGGTCCRVLISRSTSWFVSEATVSLWHIEDVRNEARSGIKDPHGKQLILLEPPGGRRLATL